MIALNIAIYFSNEVNKQLKNLQNNISNNLINFNKERVPHITLIQFFCDNTNIEKINTYVQNINLNDFCKNICYTHKKIVDNYIVYKMIPDEENFLIEIRNKILNDIESFIEYPKKDNMEFVENIKYDGLHELVLNNSKSTYLPHITLGLSKENNPVNIMNDNFYINSKDMKIKLFQVGDFGTTCSIVV